MFRSKNNNGDNTCEHQQLVKYCKTMSEDEVHNQQVPENSVQGANDNRETDKQLTVDNQ